jgi:hypothetical protein
MSDDIIDERTPRDVRELQRIRDGAQKLIEEWDRIGESDGPAYFNCANQLRELIK